MPQLQLLSALPGHTEPAWQVAFNPTRPILASCSTDKTVRLYQYTLPSTTTTATEEASGFPSASSPAPRLEYQSTITTQHKKSIRSIGWSPNGKALATGSFDSSVGVWEEVDPDADADAEPDAEGGREGVYRPEAVSSTAGTPQDQGENSDIDVDGEEKGSSGTKEWECVTTLEGHESECKSVGWSSDGALLASCSRDRSVWVWEVQPDSDFECIAVMMEHSQDVKCIAWHPHEEILASASYDSHIHLLFDDPDSDWTAFQKLHPKLPPASLSVPPQHPLADLLSRTDEETRAETELNVPPLEEDETVWCLAWNPSGEFMASGGDGGGIRIWARQGNQPDSPFVEALHIAVHNGPVFSLSFAPIGLAKEKGGRGVLASAGSDGRVIIWQLSVPVDSEHEVHTETQKKKVDLTPIAGVRDAHGVHDVNALAWNVREDGRGSGMLSTAGDDGSIKVWRVVA